MVYLKTSPRPSSESRHVFRCLLWSVAAILVCPQMSFLMFRFHVDRDKRMRLTIYTTPNHQKKDASTAAHDFKWSCSHQKMDSFVQFNDFRVLIFFLLKYFIRSFKHLNLNFMYFSFFKYRVPSTHSWWSLSKDSFSGNYHEMTFPTTFLNA